MTLQEFERIFGKDEGLFTGSHKLNWWHMCKIILICCSVATIGSIVQVVTSVW